MPYRSIAELPESVKVLPVEAQRLFLRVVNAALEQYSGDEGKAFATAWAAVKKQWKKTDDKWVKKGSEIAFDYLAEAKPLEEEDKHFAEIYIIDTTKNKAKWQVTDEALERALTSLIGTSLLAYPDHCGSIEIGKFVDVTKPNGYAIGKAEILTEEAWEKIHGGEWKYVSPQVKGFSINENGIDVVYDFTFEHVAFVPNPAYPNTQVLSAQMEEGSLRTFSAALTSELDQVRKSIEKEEKEMSEQIAELQTQITNAETKIASLEAENKTLKASLDAIEKERHAARVNELADLRLQAKLFDAGKRAEEIVRLDKYSDDVLNQLIADTKTFIANMPKPTGPKAKYTAEQSFDAVEKVRMRMFGYARDKEGKIVGGV